jgi:hypothetical protein
MDSGNNNGNLIRDKEEEGADFDRRRCSPKIEAASEDAVMGTWLSPRLFSRDGHFSPSLQLRPLLRTLRWSKRLVPAVLGLVLLVAAALKTHQLAVESNPESSLIPSHWFRIGLVELELGLGLGLLLGIYPRQIRLAAVICFTTFAAVALQQALAGKACCSYFGAL